ncbi:hypothetical protein HYU14_05835 [Candidatus Woesearchaeota archaeon]|nr:hypothetical protein [Candidatus Woesearchaeota archaeon]
MNFRFAFLAVVLLAVFTGCSLNTQDNSGSPTELPSPSDGQLSEQTDTGGSTEQGSLGEPLPQLEVGEIEPLPANIPQEEGMTIKTFENEFAPSIAAVLMNREVTWTSNDARRHLISCYKEGKRVFQGEDMMPGMKTVHSFSSPGLYTCVDAIYGVRGKVRVDLPPRQAAMPTGAAITGYARGTQSGFLALLMVIAVMAFIVKHYHKKKK